MITKEEENDLKFTKTVHSSVSRVKVRETIHYDFRLQQFEIIQI